MQRIAPDGARRWGDRGLRICAAPGMPFFPTIASDGVGGLLVAWQDYREFPGGSRIFGCHVTADGRATGQPNGEHLTTAPEANEVDPRLVTLDRGGAVLLWKAGPTRAAQRSLYAEKAFAALGKPPQAVLLTATTNLGEIGVAPGHANEVWVAWIDLRDGGGGNPYAERLLPSSFVRDRASEEARAVCAPSSLELSQPLIVAARDGALVMWNDSVRPRAARLLATGRFRDAARRFPRHARQCRGSRHGPGSGWGERSVRSVGRAGVPVRIRGSVRPEILGPAGDRHGGSGG